MLHWTTCTRAVNNGSDTAADKLPLQPCCVCKDEKSQRDECMLFSNSDDPQKDCEPIMSKYRSCMASYGFTIGGDTS